MPVVLIALGSNVGDRVGHLQAAVVELARLGPVVAASYVYETAPMYVVDQPAFLNAAIRMELSMSPVPLLRRLKEIEERIGRVPVERNGPRIIDLDLVGYGSLAYRYSNGKRTVLQVPHPRTPERRFVLQPLDDIASDFLLPGIGRIHDLLGQTEGQAESVTRSEHALFPI